MPRAKLGPLQPVAEVFEAIDNAEEITGPSAPLVRGAVLGAEFGTAARIFNSLVGVPTATIVQGRIWRTSVSGAGSGARIDYTGHQRVGRWPVGSDMSLLATASRFPQRFEYSVLVLRDPVPVLDVPFGITLEIGPNTIVLLSQSTAMVGMSLESRATVNGGRWTVYWRRLRLDALSTFDTGIAPLVGVPQRIGLRYDHQLVPRMSALIDGAPVFSLEGLAQVPDATSPTGSSTQRSGMGQNNVPNVVGQTDRWVEAQVKITKLPGYPT